MDVPKGFTFAGVSAGIKADSSKKDMTLIAPDGPCAVAGVYTQNLVVAAPVTLDRQRTPSNSIRGVIVNSGNANACTGQQGCANAEAMAASAAAEIGCEAEEVLVMSTGIIGVQLPMEKILDGARHLGSLLGGDGESFLAAADGFLTTDNGRKISSRQIDIGSEQITIAGIAKGAGMIGINMATFLSVVMTDAKIDAATLQSIQSRVIQTTFNCVSVEGHTSTNDTFLLMASGAVGNSLSADELQEFESVLEEVCLDLAKMIPADGEGASHVLEIEVSGAGCDHDARVIAETVAHSNLVKTCITGNDPNWGRIVSAVGYAGIDIDADQIVLHLLGQKLFERSEPVVFNAAKMSSAMRNNREISIQLRVGSGSGNAKIWTSDLTTDYVVFNADYHT